MWVDTQPIFTQNTANPWATQSASQQTVESIYELLRTRRFVQDILVDAGLADPVEVETVSDTTLDDIRKNIQVTWYGPHVVVIEYAAKEAEIATSVVAATMNLFNARNLQVKKENAAVAASFYESQVENYRAQLAQAADELRVYKEKHPAPADPRTPRPPAEEQELTRLQKQYDAVDITYRGLVNKLDESTLARDAELRAAPVSFRVLDRPSIPKSQTTDIRRMALFSGGGLAAILGLVMVVNFLLTILDTTVRGPEDLHRLAAVPVIAVLPQEK